MIRSSHILRPARLGLLLPILVLMLSPGKTPANDAPNRPNVIIVLTDDQGYGDLSCHGNPVVNTPHLDRLQDQSVRLTDFHVAPLCTPTRSQLMTGLDALATGAYCVCSGHEFLTEGLPTMADIFARNGYRTGLFGKWHLGDNHPYRPQDRGFQDTVSFGGWGLVSTANRWDCEYMDPWLTRNGVAFQAEGYCEDVFFTEAMKWMKARAKRREPFFLFLPTNLPHGPEQIPASRAEPYAHLGATTANFFGMIDNIDLNMGRLVAFLEEAGLANDTLLIFMTDNGSTHGEKVFNAGMRGGKASYYDGGHRVPCFVRWPDGGLREPGDVPALTQVQDILPTLIDLCGLTPIGNVTLDGTSLARILRGQPQPALANRMLVVQCALWNEYKGANKWASAVLWKQWRLVKGTELYDIRTDPGQETDVSAGHPDVVTKMRAYYEQWWERVEPLAREFPPIHLGADGEPATSLNCQSWVAPNTANQPWVRKGIERNGPWHVQVVRAGDYDIALRRWPAEADLPIIAPAPAYEGRLARYPQGVALPIATARLQIAGVQETQPIGPEDRAAVFRVTLPSGRTTLRTRLSDKEGRELCGAYYVDVTRVGN